MISSLFLPLTSFRPSYPLPTYLLSSLLSTILYRLSSFFFEQHWFLTGGRVLRSDYADPTKKQKAQGDTQSSSSSSFSTSTSTSSSSRNGEESTTAWKLGFKNPTFTPKVATSTISASVTSETNSADLAPAVRGSVSKEPSGSSLMGVMTGEKKILRAGVAATSAPSTGAAGAGAGAGSDTYRDRTQKPAETGTMKMIRRQAKACGEEGRG